jgi:hypothetical protein
MAAPPLIRDIAKHPVLSKVHLIAEPWDLGMYQVGGTGGGGGDVRFEERGRAWCRGGRGGVLSQGVLSRGGFLLYMASPVYMCGFERFHHINHAHGARPVLCWRWMLSHRMV